MMRVRLKADGRLVQILDDGREMALPPSIHGLPEVESPSIAPDRPAEDMTVAIEPIDAAYAKRVRSQVSLTQAEFASRIGVPLETVRNWEQGKRAPRGPARALLKLIHQVPHVAFSVLSQPPRPSI